MSFAGDIQQFTVVATNGVDRVRNRLVRSLFMAIVRDTPVLTGLLQSNWLVSWGGPRENTVPIGTLGIIQAEISAVLKMVKGLDEPIYFRNNLHYAGTIEFDGYSRKAPEGMMRINVIKAVDMINRLGGSEGPEEVVL